MHTLTAGVDSWLTGHQAHWWRPRGAPPDVTSTREETWMRLSDLSPLFVCVAFAAFADRADAQTTYEITVRMDPLTSADDELFTAASMAAPAGEVAHNLRKLAAGLYMELRLLALQRVDGDVLTLDDGSLVVLQEGDTIRAKKVRSCSPPQYCDPTPTGAVLLPFPPVPASGTPSIIEIYRNGVCTRALFSRSRGTSRRSGNAFPRFSDIDCAT